MRVVFLGTPEFAVPVLQAVHGDGHEVIGVFTQPDRPSGRGHKLMPPPVKVAAEELGIKVFQPKRIKGRKGLESLLELKPEIVVTAAFGQILSAEILEIPTRGTVNVHASLLPKYRGAAPINRCIAAGETVTGITTMYTDVGIDTGDMIYQREIAIGEDETAGELSERLAVLGAELIVKTLQDIEKGIAPRIQQEEKLASYQPMMEKEDGRIDFCLSAKNVKDHVRGMTPWPSAWMETEEGRVKILSCEIIKEQGKPGTILHANPEKGIIIACGEDSIFIKELQAPGKKKMSSKDFMRGYRGSCIMKCKSIPLPS